MFTSRLRRNPFILSLAGLLIAGCANAASPVDDGPHPRRILFVGNSFTYTNALPDMVKALAAAAGAESLTVESVTFPGVSLEDHWNQGMALDRITAAPWDLVIMQQGPSSLLESRALLLDYATRFDPAIRAAGARPAFYMVWPDRSRPEDFDGVRTTYTVAADSLHGMLFPAGEAWRAVWRLDPSVELYSSDNLHPTELGTYVVALVMVGQLTGRPIVGLPATFTVGGESGYQVRIPNGVARLVQEGAAEAVLAFGRK